MHAECCIDEKATHRNKRRIEREETSTNQGPQKARETNRFLNLVVELLRKVVYKKTKEGNDQ